jgi:hypothetical protein
VPAGVWPKFKAGTSKMIHPPSAFLLIVKLLLFFSPKRRFYLFISQALD